MVKEHKSIVEYKFDTQLLVDIGDKDVDDAEDEFREFVLTKLVGDSLVVASVEGEDQYGNPENFIKIHFFFALGELESLIKTTFFARTIKKN